MDVRLDKDLISVLHLLVMITVVLQKDIFTFRKYVPRYLGIEGKKMIGYMQLTLKGERQVRAQMTKC